MRILFLNMTNEAFDSIRITTARAFFFTIHVFFNTPFFLPRQAMIVAVLDMDETLGVYHNNVFHPRPKLDFMIKMMRAMDIEIILWSLGDDNYVKRVVNGFLPSIYKFAHKIFARSEAKISMDLYGYSKASERIREMYDEPIFLIGVDDKVTENMDHAYDIRIYVKPYDKPENKDRALLDVCEKIVEGVGSVKDFTPTRCITIDY